MRLISSLIKAIANVWVNILLVIICFGVLIGFWSHWTLPAIFICLGIVFVVYFVFIRRILFDNEG